jgi:hypothetical protein
MSSVPNSTEKQPFFIMSVEQIQKDYKDKLITTEAYILYLLQSHRSAGWKWSFVPKEFCNQWGIKERTFYHALSKLKTQKRVCWQTDGKVILWWGADIANVNSSDLGNSQDVYRVKAPQSVAEDVQHVAVPVQSVAVKVQHVAVPVQYVAQEMSETLTAQELQNPIYIKQIKTDTTDSREELVVALEFCEETQEIMPSAIAPNAPTQEAALEFCEETQELKPVAPSKNSQELPREAELKQMGVRVRDPELQKAIAAYQGQIITPIRAFLEYAKKKEVKNPTSAFTSAVRQRWEPDKNYEDGGLPKEENAPTSEQLVKLQELKSQGVIADFYFSDSGVTKVVPFREILRGKQMIKIADANNCLPWWEVLRD